MGGKVHVNLAFVAEAGDDAGYVRVGKNVVEGYRGEVFNVVAKTGFKFGELRFEFCNRFA